MKKVRYAIAIGAVPALGLMMPTAQAAGATAHAPAKSKKVMHPHHRRACAPISVVSNHVGTGSKRLSEITFFQPHSCVFSESGFLYHTQRSLDMRVRGYFSKIRVYQKFVGGNFSGGATHFHDRSINRNFSQVCIALVSNGRSPGVVRYGPVCTKP
jgi:hypothetical protein